MSAFLKSLTNKSWKSLIFNWTYPHITNAKGEKEPKLEVDWIEVEDEAAFGNSHALNAIFNGVDKKFSI